MSEERRLRWFEFIETNRVGLVKELEQYDENPVGMRNLCAELGVELTPIELKELVELIRDSL